MEHKVVLHAEKISYSYPGNQYDSVKDVSLKINEGSCLGIIGPNGAGKSTLISMLCGLIEINRGIISYYPEKLGLAQNRKEMQQKIEKHVALIPQEYAFYPELTIKQNLTYFIALNGYEGAHEKELLTKTLAQCQLTDVANKKADSLSGGYKRRLNIAIALSKSPKIIFLDEPTVGIDPASRKSIVELLQQLKSQEITLIYTSHILSEIEELCDEVLLLESGKAVSVNRLSNKKPLLSFELNEDSNKSNLLKTLGIDKNQWSNIRFQIKIESEQQLKQNLQILTNDIQIVKNIHYSQNSIDQVYFDSLKAKTC